ncbi:MFS transporter [Streptomyces aidingensis]|uniref:MFS transporter, YNFM family, putative membrane transport protein n=1 Tax=Streptomyces aidingensis TaxID=910347 RepID=A0A1I1EIY2_9ACTN|nr:MFS transporter [Streptomyces aidingensis]SFB86646.1 MFS transporter, YNFM family, putative membrane transport protein [Streptomyces aidingensis]
MPSATSPAPATAGASAPSFPSATATATATDHPHPSPVRVNLALFGIGVATFALLFSTQALLPEIGAAFGVRPDQASWTVSATTLALAAAVLPLSLLSERVGRRAMMTGSVTVAVAVALVLPFAPGLPALIALRAVQGAALAGIPASAVAYLSEEVDRRAMVGAIGLFIAGNSVGGMSGRMAGGWVAEGFGWRAGLAAVALLALAGAVLYGLLLPRQRRFTASRPGPREMAATVAGHLTTPLLLRLFTIGALLMTAFNAVYTAIAFRLAEEPFGLSPGIVGSVFVIFLVGTGSSSLTGPLVDRLGRRGALYAAMGAVGAGLLLSLWDSLPAVLLGLVLITGGFFSGHAVASASVGRAADTGRAQAAALYQVGYYTGASAGGLLGALSFHWSGWAGTVALAFAALLVSAAVTLYATLRAGTASRTVAGAA